MRKAELLDGLAPTDIEIKRVFWSNRFHTHYRLAEQFRTGRVLLAGDAAHVCGPLAGQGLNLGLHDAWNLGWKLALVTNGLATDALLASYEAERRPIAGRLLALSDAAHRAVLAADPAWPSSAVPG